MIGSHSFLDVVDWLIDRQVNRDQRPRRAGEDRNAAAQETIHDRNVGPPRSGAAWRSATGIRGARGVMMMVFAAIVAAVVAGPASAVVVRFEQSKYSILPGATVDVVVVLDADDSTPGNQPPAPGLYSMGVGISFPEGSAVVGDESAIAVPAALDGDGAGGPARRRVGAGSAGATGAIGIDAEPYYGTVLATFSVTDVGGVSFDIGTEFFFEDSRVNFVDFDGAGLDELLEFEATYVEVIPEPCVGILAAATVAVAGLSRRRWR